METGKLTAWVGAAALAAALFFAVLAMRPADPAPPHATPQPDLFPFLKALPPEQTAVQVDGEDVSPSVSARQDRTESPPGGGLYQVEQTVRDLRLAGASEDEVYRARAAALSPETAARLAQMDQEEWRWARRIDDYLAAHNGLRHSDGTIPAAALRQLRNAHFSADEQKLLAAYESAPAPQLTLPVQ